MNAQQLTTAVVLPEQVARVDQCLQSLLDSSLATDAFLLDGSGQIVASRGERNRDDSVLLGALIAGSFASAREIARLLGENQFQTLFQQGRRHHLLTTSIGQSWLLVVVFGKKTPVGLVRVLSSQVTAELEDVLQRASGKSSKKSGTFDTSFGNSAADAIDALFGES